MLSRAAAELLRKGRSGAFGCFVSTVVDMEVHSHEHRHFRPKTPHGILGLGEEQYQKRYKQSIEDPAGFWGEVAQGYDWFAKVSFAYRLTPRVCNGVAFQTATAATYS